MRTNWGLRYLLLISALLALFATDLTLGAVNIPLRQMLQILLGGKSDPTLRDIVWDFRMTKALTCVLAGSALAIGGLQMQTLFRNALAGPDVMGLSSGASLAVAVIFMSGFGSGYLFESPWTVAMAASAGSAAVFVLMFAISRRMADNVSLLIVGLMIAATTSSVVSVIQYLSKAEEIQTFLLWTFGSLGGLNWQEIPTLTVVLLTGLLLAMANLKALNTWVLGDNYAATLGINLKTSRVLAILSASILTGGVTAFCGPIAFVGLAVPHLTRLLIETNDHKRLIPAVAVGGAILMLACDIIAQAPGGATVLPINAITALVGAPVVIWVIMRKKISRL